MTLRSTEGELGDLVVTVVASLSPLKGAKVAYCTFHHTQQHSVRFYLPLFEVEAN